MQDFPLVSVCVVSYNAEGTIIDTMESIKEQDYPNIEVIVSDDCSTDNTVTICKQWMKDNEGLFVRCVLLTADQNQGVCKNCNKCFKEAKGIWIKGIAADDKLSPCCIKDNMEYALSHPGAEFINSRMDVYKEKFLPECLVQHRKGPENTFIFNEPVEKQLRRMAYNSYIYAPAMFYTRHLIESVGWYDDRYGFEDWPFYITILENGYPLHFMDKVTVCYRIHDSQSHTKRKLFNYTLWLRTKFFIKERCFKYYTLRKRFATRMQWAYESFLYKAHLDKDTKINKFIYRKTLAVLYRLGGNA